MTSQASFYWMLHHSFKSKSFLSFEPYHTTHYSPYVEYISLRTLGGISTTSKPDQLYRFLSFRFPVVGASLGSVPSPCLLNPFASRNSSTSHSLEDGCFQAYLPLIKKIMQVWIYHHTYLLHFSDSLYVNCYITYKYVGYYSYLYECLSTVPSNPDSALW